MDREKEKSGDQEVVTFPCANCQKPVVAGSQQEIAKRIQFKDFVDEKCNYCGRISRYYPHSGHIYLTNVK